MSIDVEELRRMAEAQAAAHARMLEIGEGVGGLGYRHPAMFEDMRAWGDRTDNDHADTVLALLDEVERLRGEESFWRELATVRTQAEAERDRLRGERDDLLAKWPFTKEFEAMAAERDRLRAAVDAVRALADEFAGSGLPGVARRIRAALDEHLGEG